MFSLIGRIDLLCRFRKCGRVTKNQDLPAWHESCMRLVTSDVNSTSSEKLTCSQSSNTSSSLAVEARCSIRRHISAQRTAGISCYSAQKPALLDRKVLTLLSGTQYSLLPGLRGCRDHLKRHTHLLSFPATTPLCVPPAYHISLIGFGQPHPSNPREDPTAVYMFQFPAYLTEVSKCGRLDRNC